jgi:hypothetical protein
MQSRTGFVGQIVQDCTWVKAQTATTGHPLCEPNSGIECSTRTPARSCQHGIFVSTDSHSIAKEVSILLYINYRQPTPCAISTMVSIIHFTQRLWGMLFPPKSDTKPFTQAEVQSQLKIPFGYPSGPLWDPRISTRPSLLRKHSTTNDSQLGNLAFLAVTNSFPGLELKDYSEVNLVMGHCGRIFYMPVF